MRKVMIFCVLVVAVSLSAHEPAGDKRAFTLDQCVEWATEQCEASSATVSALSWDSDPFCNTRCSDGVTVNRTWPGEYDSLTLSVAPGFHSTHLVWSDGLDDAHDIKWEDFTTDGSGQEGE